MSAMEISSRVTIAELLRRDLVRPGDEWVLTRGGQASIVGRVTVEGKLAVDGVDYTSPSTAARAALGTSTNGWKRWKYRDGSALSVVDRLRDAASTGE
jgi:hypothetical protein